MRDRSSSAPAIRGYQPRLREELAERGWSVERTDDEHIDPPWYLEVWRLTSTWSPAGFRLYLVFEFDDLFYSVGASIELPVDHHSTDWRCRLYLGRHWENGIEDFLLQLDHLRNSI